MSAIERELLAIPSAQARAERALAHVCDAAGASSGRLYLLRSGRLELAAEHGPAQFAQDLYDHARELVTQPSRAETSVVTACRPRHLPVERASEQAWLLRANLTPASQVREESVLGVVAFPQPAAVPQILRLSRALELVASALARAGDATPL